jgi:uncharacterized protein YfaT (DUF1175 family)
VATAEDHSGDITLWAEVNDQHLFVWVGMRCRTGKLKSHGGLADSTFVGPDNIAAQNMILQNSSLVEFLGCNT